MSLNRLFRVSLSLVLAGAIAVPVYAPDADAAPRPRRVLLEGRGWGHGRGMGQWGAREMARNGATWSRILRHYYTGVRVQKKASDRSRVRVLLATRNAALFTATDSFALRFDGRRVAGRAGRIYRLTPRALHVARDHNGPWRLIARPAGTVKAGGARLALVSGHGRQRAYAGTLRMSRSGDHVRIVNVVRLRHYLRGVVPREMPASWPLEALKAQTVAARTYTIRVRDHARSRGAGADICDDTRCQVYSGIAVRSRAGARWERLNRRRTDIAISRTSGRIITYKGAPILAEYSSSTGGYTIDGNAPYLRAVRDPGDRRSPNHRWLREVSAQSIRRAWPSIGRFRRMGIASRDGNGAMGGRARTVKIVGTSGVVRVPAEQFRSRLGLRSTWFRVSRGPSRHVFRRNLSFGVQHVDVGYLQKRLRSGGFYPRDWPVTSYFGSVTRSAVKRYQRARDLPDTGFVGKMTRAKLNRGRAHRRAHRYTFRFNMGYGTQHPAVKKLQLRLRAEGVYPRGGPFTNYYGPITRGAVKRYQRAHEIQQTGYLGPITRRSLNH